MSTQYARGKEHWKWRGGKTTLNGYKARKVHDHPYATARGYVYDHRLIMEKSIGRYLEPTERVHHIDGNPLNNRLKNLIILTHREHIHTHVNPDAKWDLLDDITWLTSQIESGVSAVKIAKEIGCKDLAVRKALDKHNIRKPVPGRSTTPKCPELLDKAWLEEKTKTMSQYQIADLLGCNQRLVWKYQKRHGIQSSHKPGPKIKGLSAGDR